MICEDSITSSITTSSSDPALSRSKQAIINDIESAVDEWEDTVIWNRGRINIITTNAYTLPTGQSCARRTLGVPVISQNQVVFVSNAEMTRSGCITLPKGCWRTNRWAAIFFGPIAQGAILLKASYGADWNSLDTNTGCTFLHQIVVHEAGHAFGIGNGHWLRLSFNQHPINRTHSVMSYNDPSSYCGPQAYDVVAVMANYQSR